MSTRYIFPLPLDFFMAVAGQLYFYRECSRLMHSRGLHFVRWLLDEQEPREYSKKRADVDSVRLDAVSCWM
jgi:hypothetical protein